MMPLFLCFLNVIKAIFYFVFINERNSICDLA